MIRRIFLLACALVPTLSVLAFSPYYNGGRVLRWDSTYAGNDPLLFNPTTKAIRYWIGSDTATTANRTAELNAIRASFAQWQAIPGTTIKFEEMGVTTTNQDIKLGDHRNLIYFSHSTLVNGGTESISGKVGYTEIQLDSLNHVLEADIVLNAAANTFTTDFNSISAAKFVESFATHEIGHLLGLDHTPLGGATVIDGGPGVGPMAGLSPDEISAARYLYPATGTLATLGTITGFVKTNNIGIRGALVTAEDGHGNAVQATLTDSTGKYTLWAIVPGAYFVRVSPLDPTSASTALSLFRDVEVYGDNANTAVVTFKPSTNVPANVTANGITTINFAVTSGEPAFRIQQVSPPTTAQSGAAAVRYASWIHQGESAYIAVAGVNIPSDAVLSVSGDGVTVGPMRWVQSYFFSGANLLQAPLTVALDATPGLRSYVVKRGNDVAYANGYLEIVGPTIDYNFDGLDDRFQRRYFPLWTAPEAAPTADPDGDGFSNAFELLTTSNPTDPTSFNFAIDHVDFAVGSRKVTWKADIGKKYQLYGKTDIAGATWTAVGAQVTASANSVTITDPDTTSLNKFYKLKRVP